MRFGRAWLAALLAAGTVLVLAVPAPASAGPDLTALAGSSVRSPIAGERFYFVMTDRYRNGDPSNDTGGSGMSPVFSKRDATVLKGRLAACPLETKADGVGFSPHERLSPLPVFKPE